MKSDHFLIRLQILVSLLLASILIFACQRLGLIELAYNLASVSKPGSVIVEENFRNAIPAFLGKLLIILLFFGSICYKPASLMVPAFVKYFSRDYPPFLSPLKDNTEDKLSPYNPNTPFKGRKEELTRLHEFAARPQQFLYWTLAGPPGVGKTRLAIEWVRNLTKRRTWVGGKVWDAGFFQANSREEAWLSWQPRRPTVILIDDFSTCREALRPMLAAIPNLKPC